MTLNDYYYETVAKQHAAELQAIAADDRLAKIARQAAKRKRADQREVRRLQAAVHGRRTLRQALGTLFVGDRPATDDRVSAEADQTADVTADKPAPVTSH